MRDYDEHICVIRYDSDMWTPSNRFLYHVVCHNDVSILVSDCSGENFNTNFNRVWIRPGYH